MSQARAAAPPIARPLAAHPAAARVAFWVAFRVTLPVAFTVAFTVAFLAPLLAAVLAGCASPPAPPPAPPPVTDRVILLPQADGSPSALLLAAGSQTLLLAQPYAGAELQGGVLRAVTTDAASVQKSYGALLAQQPARPRSFVLPFEPNTHRLGAAAEPVLAELRAALASLPAAEVIVTGHTDRVGSVEANDRLSLARAEAVRELLVGAGVARAVITVAGRGERAPLVATADEVAEPRNRRVEIKIR